MFCFRSKSCKKDLWAQINTALQTNNKWQRSDLGIQGSFSYHRTQFESIEEVELQQPTQPCIHMCNFSTSVEVSMGHPIFLAHAPTSLPPEVINEHPSGNLAWVPCLNDSHLANSWFEQLAIYLKQYMWLFIEIFSGVLLISLTECFSNMKIQCMKQSCSIVIITSCYIQLAYFWQ